MAKRFTDSDKWKKIWFRSLSPAHKAFWFYLCDNCDQAGVWEVDIDAASFFIGEELNQGNLLEIFAKQIIVFDDGKRWLLIDFIEFQYGCTFDELNCKNNAHKSALRIIEKFNLIELFGRAKRGHRKPSMSPSLGPMDMDMEKEMDKEELEGGMGETKTEVIEPDKSICRGPDLKEVIEYFQTCDFPEVEARKFWGYYEGQGWITGGERGQPIKNWRAKVEGWVRNSKNKNFNQGDNNAGNNPNQPVVKSGRGIVTKEEVQAGYQRFFGDTPQN